MRFVWGFMQSLFVQYLRKLRQIKVFLLQTLTKSDMLNCQHNYKDLIFNNDIMKSSLWRLYGKTHMCSLWAQVLLYLNIDTVTQTAAYYGTGYLQAVCSLAFNLLMQVICGSFTSIRGFMVILTGGVQLG